MNFSLGRRERMCWLVALALGLLQAWGRRHVSADGLAYIGADSISYLDIGDAYMRGDWHTAINAMWSPFYSWLLGITLRVFQPNAFWEFTVVRLLNFFIYAAALFAFALFLRALRQDRAVDSSNKAQLPDWTWLVFGYSIFVWTSLFMNRVSRMSPDLLVAALIFLACGLLLRIRARPSSWQLFIALGIVLGIGYLTKSVMFPLAFVFLGVGFVLARRPLGVKGALARVTMSLLLFLALSVPFIVAVSRARDRLAIADSARLNYAWYVNHTTRFIHWQGGPAGNGRPTHPTRVIFTSPAVYEFATPIGGSYPPWYDPSYWYEGVTPHFNLRQQLSAVARNLSIVYGFFFYRFFLVTVALVLFLLFYFSERRRTILRDISAYWFLILPSLVAVGLYLLINVEPRYLAPFVPVLVLSLIAALRVPATRETRRVVSVVSFAVLLSFIISVVPLTVRDGYATFRDLLPGSGVARDTEWQVADGLRQLGVQPGDPVASIGRTMFAAWPRLARVRVVAEIPEAGGEAEKFWLAKDEIRRQALAAFAGTGAQVVVTDHIPIWAKTDRIIEEDETAREGIQSSKWQRIGNTQHYIYFLTR